MALLAPKDNEVFPDKKEHRETQDLMATLDNKGLRVWLDLLGQRAREVNLEFVANLD